MNSIPITSSAKRNQFLRLFSFYEREIIVNAILLIFYLSISFPFAYVLMFLIYKFLIYGDSTNVRFLYICCVIIFTKSFMFMISTLGHGMVLRGLKSLSFVTINSALEAIAQSTNLLSSASPGRSRK